VSRLAPQERVNVDEVLPTLQRLMVAYLIQMDAHSGMGRAGFDYRWQDMPAVARNLAASPLYAFHYLKKWQRRQGLDSLPIGKAHLYLSYAEDYLADERRNPMSHARELTTLYRRFYRARRYNSNSILRPLHIAAGTLLTADRRLFDSPEALTELVFGELRRRVSKLQSDGLAFFPRGSTWEERESAMRQFTDYLVNQVYLGAMKGDPSALRGKQLNMLGSACEAIYRDESAKDWAERQEVEVAEE
jgi:CRISPR-associated protein Csc3